MSRKRKKKVGKITRVVLSEVVNRRGVVVARFFLQNGQLCWETRCCDKLSGDRERAAFALSELRPRRPEGVRDSPHESAYQELFC